MNHNSDHTPFIPTTSHPTPRSKFAVPNGTMADVPPPADKFVGPPDFCKAGGATFRIKW